MTRVKICGLTRREDAEWAIEAGADALGFIYERSSPRYIGDDLPDWLNKLPPFPLKVAVFGRVDRAPMQSIFDLVQGVEWEDYPLPAPKRIHVLRVAQGQKASDFVQQTVNAGMLLLDAYKVGAYGGTGHVIDWDVAAEIVERSEKKVVLAGGLTPENVADAIRRVRPYAVDVSSGIEREPGVKDHGKIRAFFDAVRSVS